MAFRTRFLFDEEQPKSEVQHHAGIYPTCVWFWASAGGVVAANYNKPIRSNSHLIGVDYRGPVPRRVPQMPVPLTNA
jgi:hypothetical protein